MLLGIAPCDYPAYDQTVCQTLDGDTRLYTMPFTAAGAAEGVAGSGIGKAAAAAAAADAVDATAAAAAPAAAGAPATSMWQLSFPYDEAAAAAMSGSAAQLKAEAMRRCGGWHAPIPALLASTQYECVTGYPVYDRPLLDTARCRGAPASLVS